MTGCRSRPGRATRATRPRRSPTASLVGLALATGVALVLAGCGIPTDHSPRAIGHEDLPAGLAPQTTTTLAVGTDPARIFLVHNDGSTAALAAITVGIPGTKDLTGRVREVMTQLIKEQPAGGATQGLTNTIPSSVKILDLKVDGTVLDLDVSGLDNVESTQQRLAFAQMVYTATDLPGIEAVRFSINHHQAQVPLDTAASQLGEAIDRGAYSQLQSSQ